METLNIEELKEEAVRIALYKSKGCVTEAANLLGITRATVYKKAKEYKLDIDKIREHEDSL